jgi:hypothetical protein
MNLDNPVTIQPPITLSSLDFTIMDNATRKSVVAQIRHCPYPLALWTGDAYTAVGDYTQAQVEARILELLGSDIKVGLEKLFILPALLTRN